MIHIGREEYDLPQFWFNKFGWKQFRLPKIRGGTPEFDPSGAVRSVLDRIRDLCLNDPANPGGGVDMGNLVSPFAHDDGPKVEFRRIEV